MFVGDGRGSGRGNVPGEHAVGRDRNRQRLPDRAMAGIEMTAVGVGVMAGVVVPCPRHRGKDFRRNGGRAHLERHSATGRGRHEPGWDRCPQDQCRQSGGKKQALMRSAVHDADQIISHRRNRG